MQDPSSFGSEELFSALTSDLCNSLTDASSMSASQAMRSLHQLCPKRFQHTNICDDGLLLFAMPNTLSVISVSNSSLRVTGLSNYGVDWTAETLTSGCASTRGLYRFIWSQDSTQQRVTRRLVTSLRLSVAVERHRYLRLAHFF